jgi:hypothetical protein
MDRGDQEWWHAGAHLAWMLALAGCGPSVADAPTATTDATTTDASSSVTTMGASPCIDHTDCDEGSEPICVAGTCTTCTDALDPDLACGQRSAEAPACSEDGRCVVCNETNTAACPSEAPACSDDGRCVVCNETDAAACPAETPVCEDFACRGCLEHSECPDSACHLSGSTAGRCFDRSQVLDVSSQQQINAALAPLQDGDAVVLRTALGTDYEVEFDNDAEVAVLEQSSLPVDQRPTLSVSILHGTLYAAQTNIQSWCGYYSGDTANAPKTQVWVDDSVMEHTLGAGCETHVRRSTVQRLFQVVHSALSVESSVLIDPHARIVQPGEGQWATVDIVASTIIGPFTCLGPVDVEVRNSILLASEDSESLETMQCSAGSVSYSATSDDAPGEGNVEVGPLMPTWFVGAAAGDYHLAEGHPFDGIARWQDGDPRTDIDGDPRTSLPNGMEVAGADVP